MGSHRKERVRELLKRAIGEAIRREIPLDSAGFITVNDVELASDLRVAHVFVSVLGGPEKLKTGLAALQAARLRIQDLVAKSIILKYMPQLRFVADDSVERGDRVLKILEELERTQPET